VESTAVLMCVLSYDRFASSLLDLRKKKVKEKQMKILEECGNDLDTFCSVFFFRSALSLVKPTLLVSAR